MSIRDLFRGDADDLRAAPSDLALRIQHHAVGLCVAPDEPGMAVKASAGRYGICAALGELLSGDAADEPGVAVECVVQPLEQACRDTAFRFPAAEKRLAVDAGSHVADHVGLHWIVLAANACIALRLVSTFFLLRLVDKLDRHLRGSGCFQCFEAGIDLSQFDQPARMTKIFIEYG